jgi:hypothetical protein
LIIENVFPQSNDKKNEVLYGEGQCLWFIFEIINQVWQYSLSQNLKCL